MKVKNIAVLMMILGGVALVADVANFFPAKSGAYAIAGAILIAAGVLILADN